jgi:hypothetical protein
MDRSPRIAAGRILRVAMALAGALAMLFALAGSSRAEGGGATPPALPSSGGFSATVEGCLSSPVQSERSATFGGEMTAVSGTLKMSMRIEVQERLPGEAEFHAVSVPGLDTWRSSDEKVKVYKYLKQVTNLSAPASYRAVVQFRWLSAKGRLIKHAERLTERCVQRVSSSEPPAQGTLE